jgi:hypothetical protein
LQGLNIQAPLADAAATAGDLVEAEPITEEKKITAKYRVTKKEGDSRMSFAPVQRVHQLDTGALTELVDIHFNLNDKLKDFGEMRVGDEKEFSLTVRVLTGYRPAQQDMPSATG